MPIGTKAEVNGMLGNAWHVQAGEANRRLAYVTYAGNPTNNLVPEFIGQDCLDTSNSDWYRSHGTAAANWKKLTP
jgi:hypothetical protein